MQSTFHDMNFLSIDDVCKVLKQHMFRASVDISSAYRSVSVRADQWGYQGIQWNFGDGDHERR